MLIMQQRMIMVALFFIAQRSMDVFQIQQQLNGNYNTWLEYAVEQFKMYLY